MFGEMLNLTQLSSKRSAKLILPGRGRLVFSLLDTVEFDVSFIGMTAKL